MDEFGDYLTRKKIDPLSFQRNEPQLYKEFKIIFDQVHPDSFTAQKLYLINKIRRKYPFSDQQ